MDIDLEAGRDDCGRGGGSTYRDTIANVLEFLDDLSAPNDKGEPGWEWAPIGAIRTLIAETVEGMVMACAQRRA